MMCIRMISRTIKIACLALLLTACSTVKISPPSPEVQALLVLPVTTTNTSRRQSYSFHYKYEISSVKENKVVEEVVFRPPVKNGFLIVDSLPPGAYFVSSVIVVPVGTGTTSYNNRRKANERFSLESGSLTILQSSLDISVVNNPTDPGETFYYHKINSLYLQQEREILENLGQMPFFDAWKIQE
jgi:hypothetical protein